MRALRGLIVLAACGTPQADVDAGIDDAVAPDAATLGPTGEVQVIVRGHGPFAGQLAVGTVVYASSPDGVLGAQTTTDANGEATLAITAGDTVTSLGMHVFSSVAGVFPGDTLVLGDRVSTDTTPFGPPMTLQWPAIGDATSYDYQWPCGYGSTNLPETTITRRAHCSSDTTEVLVRANGVTSTGNTLLYQGGVPWIDGGTYAVTVGWHAPRGLEVTLSGGDPYTNGMVSVVNTFETLRTFENTFGFGDPSGSGFTRATTVPHGPSSRTVRYVLYTTWDERGGAEVVAPGITSHAFADPILLRRLGAGAVGSSPLRAIWLEEPRATDDADYVVVKISDWAGGLEGGYRRYWQIVLPPDAPPDVRLPPLPRGYTFGNVLLQFDAVAAYATDSLATYRDVVAQPEDALRCPDLPAHGYAFPEVRFSRFGNLCP